MPPPDPLRNIIAARFGKDEPDAWPVPIPLGEAVGPPPPFPIWALPSWMHQHVADVANELQASPDLPAMLCLVALSIACAGKRRIHVRSTWYEQLNLYLVVALPPSAGKSPAFKAMLGVLERWEYEEAERLAPQIEHVAQKRRMIEQAMKRAEAKNDHSEAMQYLDELQHAPEIVAPRIRADDATPEALVDLMARHGGVIALTSTEGGPFELMGGRYSEKANLDVYLKAWSGDSIRIDRIGRGASTVQSPTLTVGLTVQPDVLHALADRPEFAGRGLTARFMYAMPLSLVGRRNLIDIPAVTIGVREEYDRLLLRLFIAERAQAAPKTVTIDDDARMEFLTWRQSLEHRRGASGDLSMLAEWTTKLESSVARTAALLALAEGREVVDIAVMRRAMAIGLYWLEHAKIVHDLWGADPDMVAAKEVMEWATEREIDTFSVRDLFRSMRRRTRFQAVEDMRQPLELLTERGWIRPLFDGPLVLGRRGVASPEYTVYPHTVTR